MTFGDPGGRAHRGDFKAGKAYVANLHSENVTVLNAGEHPGAD